MISVFSGFILGNDPVIKSVGFTLAFGILVDAFVVRMTLIPAVMALLGDRMWWLPKWLDRILPHVDIEGRSLPPVDLADSDVPSSGQLVGAVGAGSANAHDVTSH
jgi:putative drug exporter of the RND superfamily